MNKRSVAPGAGVCRARRLLRLDRKKMTSADNRKSEQYDAWYVKVVFGVFLCVLVGSLIALYSGVPVPHFIVTR